MLGAGVFLILTSCIIGSGLLWARSVLRGRENDAVDAALALLPRVECGQCGYPGCRPYAEAIVNEGAKLNRCPPGGELTVRRLARLVGQPVEPLSKAGGNANMDQIAQIDPAQCIGCYRCIEVCPVDAIFGSPQYLHTVLADECTGCELCLAPCPVDCIDLVAR